MESTVTPATAAPTPSKPRVRISTTPEERAEWVRLFEESGKTASQFCQDLGLAETTFAVWRRQVREASCTEGVTFTDVPLASAAEPGALAIVFPNGTRLEVAAGTDTTWLAQLGQPNGVRPWTLGIGERGGGPIR